ncbi:MAG TPA: DMT family transporter [Chthonomonadales bacterium]|nr:DMT family transporter [Chthonomonadales bacterium]
MSARGTPAGSTEAPVGRLRHPSVLDVVLLVAINVLWAGSSAPAKIALGSAGDVGRVGPFTLAFVRFAVAAGLFALTLAVLRHPVRVARADVPRFLLAGFVGIAVTYGLFYHGVRASTAVESGLLFAAQPVLIALLARVLLREVLTPGQAWGLALGFAGVYLIAVQGLVPRLSAAVVGNLIIGVAVAFESFACIVCKGLTRRYAGVLVVFLQMLIGSLLLLPFAAAEIARYGPPVLSPSVIGSVAYLALVCSFLCFGIWFVLLPRLNVSLMAGFLFVQPIVSPIYAYVLLSERLGWWSLGGGALVVAGVWLVAVRGVRRAGESASRTQGNAW